MKINARGSKASPAAAGPYSPESNQAIPPARVTAVMTSRTAKTAVGLSPREMSPPVSAPQGDGSLEPKRVERGRSGSVRVALGGVRILEIKQIKQKKTIHIHS